MSARRTNPSEDRRAWLSIIAKRRDRHEATATAEVRLRDATHAQLRAEIRAKRKP